jgi:hypothetical protein
LEYTTHLFTVKKKKIMAQSKIEALDDTVKILIDEIVALIDKTLYLLTLK